MKTYGNYISLGENCETAFQIRRVLGRDSSSFFNWNISPFEAIFSLIEKDFSGIMQAQNISRHGDGSLVNDESHGYKFHSMFPREEGVDYNAYPDILAKHQSKAAYLISKFKESSSSVTSTAYFYKTSDADAREKSVKLRQTLASYRGDDNGFDLIVVQPETYRSADWQVQGVSNRYVKRFAPIHDATDGHVSSWDKIFKEFPHEQGLRLSGY